MALASRPKTSDARPADTQSRARASSLRPLIAIAALVLLLAWLLSIPDLSQISVLDDGAGKTALILTAHPDDEVMFFTPTILGLITGGWEVSALCLSNGGSCPYTQAEESMLI